VKHGLFHPGFAQQLVAMILLAAFGLGVQGQTWTQYDQGTPPQHAAGVSSLGNYLSTDLGVVNLSNGALNIKLPMGTVGGRGFSIPITLNFGSKVWSAAHDTTYNQHLDTDVGMAYARYGGADFSEDIFNRVAPGWTIGGTPLLRKGGSAINQCTQGYYLYDLTKLTVILPDKGEIQLRDDLHEGVPLYRGCSPTFVEDRGQRWHATDGSGIIFISDNANGVVNNDFLLVVLLVCLTLVFPHNDTEHVEFFRSSDCCSVLCHFRELERRVACRILSDSQRICAALL